MPDTASPEVLNHLPRVAGPGFWRLATVGCLARQRVKKPLPVGGKGCHPLSPFLGSTEFPEGTRLPYWRARQYTRNELSDLQVVFEQ